MKPLRLTRSVELHGFGYLKAGTVITSTTEQMRGRLVSRGYAVEQACHYLTEEQYEALVNPERQSDGIPGDGDFASDEPSRGRDVTPDYLEYLEQASEEEPNDRGDLPEDCSEHPAVQDGDA